MRFNPALKIIQIMIADIIKDVYRGDQEQHITDLLNQKIICGNLFRSFDNFTQHLIFQMYANNFHISRSDIFECMTHSAHLDEGRELFNRAVHNLTSIKVVTSPNNDIIQLNDSFAKNLQKFITTRQPDRGQTYDNKDDSFFNLLLLLDERNQILRQCKIGNMSNQDTLSKQNFDFIRLPIGYKISILIKGYLKFKKNHGERKQALKNILMLSQMDCNRKHKIPENQPPMISEFERLHLLKKVEKTHFIISPFLHNFAFEEKKNTKLLECSIIIQTNFKVYVQIPKTDKKHNYRLILSILRKLIEITHDNFKLQQLIVGQIKQYRLTPLYLNSISVQDYLSFFLQFMADNLKVEKDLGKWNKITFLGLQGPEHEMMIPNNVKQQLKLWKTLTQSKNPQFYMKEEEQYNQDYYNQSDS